MRKSTVKRRIIRRRRMDPHTARPTNSSAKEKTSGQHGYCPSFPLSPCSGPAWTHLCHAWCLLPGILVSSPGEQQHLWVPRIFAMGIYADSQGLSVGKVPSRSHSGRTSPQRSYWKQNTARCFLWFVCLFFSPAKVIPSQKLNVHTLSFILVVVFLRACH